MSHLGHYKTFRKKNLRKAKTLYEKRRCKKKIYIWDTNSCPMHKTTFFAFSQKSRNLQLFRTFPPIVPPPPCFCSLFVLWKLYIALCFHNARISDLQNTMTHNKKQAQEIRQNVCASCCVPACVYCLFRRKNAYRTLQGVSGRVSEVPPPVCGIGVQGYPLKAAQCTLALCLQGEFRDFKCRQSRRRKTLFVFSRNRKAVTRSLVAVSDSPKGKPETRRRKSRRLCAVSCKRLAQSCPEQRKEVPPPLYLSGLMQKETGSGQKPFPVQPKPEALRGMSAASGCLFAGSIAVVNLSTVPRVHHMDNQTSVVHGVDNPVIANTETEQVFVILSL